MLSHEPNQEKPMEEQADQTLVKKVEGLQERLRKMKVASDGSVDKESMGEA